MEVHYLALQYEAQGDMAITRLFEDGPALFLPLIIDPGSCHLSQQLQTLGIWRQCKLVDLEEKKTATQSTIVHSHPFTAACTSLILHVYMYATVAGNTLPCFTM